jgi:hypothetical protein
MFGEVLLEQWLRDRLGTPLYFTVTATVGDWGEETSFGMYTSMDEAIERRREIAKKTDITQTWIWVTCL